MQEFELKSAVADEATLRDRLERAGARLVFSGSLLDRRYDTADRALAARDHVLRIRVYRGDAGERAMLDWKGPTRTEGGYKVREELSTSAGSADDLALMLDRLGYMVTRELDREIAQYEIDDATLRIERYPRMDVLLEVEGEPPAIERAIVHAGLPRDGFTTERLPEFIARFERRTGLRAAMSRRELHDAAGNGARDG